VGVDTPTLLSATDLDNTLRQRGMTVLFVTTALFNQLSAQRPDVFKSLRCLLFGGQAVSPHWVREVCTHGPPRELLHVYGPTESTTFASFQRVEQAPIEGATVPIGRPISNTQIFILDPHLNPVPVGAHGELCIGGDGLASGYLNQPALTAEKFIPHPFQSGERLYRTGDLARYLPDGAIEFVGRRDRQVKIRGYRVELEEVESALRRCAGLSDAVVIEQREGEDQRLVAYLVAGAGDRPTVEQLRSELATHLPAYMLPAAYVFVDKIPLTINGKTDLRALLASPSQTLEFHSAPTAAHNVLELQLVRVWEDVLDIRPIGVHDNFFDLGGHSLLGVRLFHRIEQEFGVRLPLAMLFNHQTVAELARHLEQSDSPQEWRTLIPIQPDGTRPPFFCVHGFGGGVLGYADLARLLGPDQPFYGLQAAGLDGDEAPDLTVAAMAARYIDAMRSVQPRGPYRIGGYCFGGVVAFEMGRQLELQGEAVALLAVMEGYAPGIQQPRPALLDAQRLITIWRNLPYWFEDYWQLGARGINLRLQRKVRMWRKRLTPRVHSTQPIDLRDVLPDDHSFVPDHHRRLMEIHLAALRDYRPQPYNGAVTLFSARGRTISNALSGSLDPQRGWGALALGGVTVHPVDGGHRNIHLPPYVASLAAALAAGLSCISVTVDNWLTSG
jgi:thioesterase domain-containing protein/acyl carrier protein